MSPARFLDFQKERIDALPPSAVVLISTHETVVSVGQWQWAGEDLEQLGKEGVPSASINTYDFDGKTFKLVSRQQLPPSPSGKDLFSMESKAKDI
jgi:broad specificity phosphatase PhoE